MSDEARYVKRSVGSDRWSPELPRIVDTGPEAELCIASSEQCADLILKALNAPTVAPKAVDEKLEKRAINPIGDKA